MSIKFRQPLDLGQFGITQLAGPTNGSDAATKAYVDSVAAGGGSGGSVGGPVLLQQVALSNSTTATVTFVGIPQNYTHLRLVCTARTTYTAGGYMWVTFNADQSASYATAGVTSAGGGGAAVAYGGTGKTTAITLPYVGQATMSRHLIEIPFYADTGTVHKHLLGQSVVAAGYASIAGTWQPNAAAAISRIDLTAYTTGYYWASGSVFNLYGISSPTGTGGGANPIVNTVTANYTINATDNVVLANGASLTVTLPSANIAGAGKTFNVKNVNASALTLASTAGTIDGSATVTLRQWQAFTVMSDGANWYII